MLKTFAITIAALVSLALASVIDLTPSTFDQVVDGSKPAFVEFFAPWCGHCKTLAPIWQELGDSYEGATAKVIIAKVDADAQKELGSRFGVQGFPTLKWFPKGWKKGDEPEAYNGGRTMEALQDFIQEKTGVVSKKAESRVAVLTSSNFDSIALNNSVNALVEFYAPWCGHCKTLAPMYEKLAAVFAREPNCVVSKVDATENEDVAKRYGVEGYPTIKFFTSRNKKNPEEYSGGRDLDSFVEYLNQKCGTHRLSDGRLSESAGVLHDLMPLFHRLMSAAANDYKQIVLDVTSTTNSLLTGQQFQPYLQSAVDYYRKVADKFVKKGTDYGSHELARLDRLIGKGDDILPEKLDDLSMRRNILRSIVYYVPGTETVGNAAHAAYNQIPTGEDVANAAQGAFNQIPTGQNIKDAANGAYEKIPSGQDVKNAANNAYEQIPSVEDIINKVTGKEVPKKRTAQDMANDAYNQIPSVEDIKNGAYDAYNRIPSVEDIKNKVTGKEVPKKRTAQDVIHDAYNQIPSVDDIKNSVNDAYAKIPSSEDIKNKVIGKDTPKKRTAQDVVHDAYNQIPSTDDIKNGVRDAYSQVPSTEDVKKRASESYENTKAGVKKAAGDAYEQIPTVEELKKKGDAAYQQVKKKVQHDEL